MIAGLSNSFVTGIFFDCLAKVNDDTEGISEGDTKEF